MKSSRQESVPAVEKVEEAKLPEDSSKQSENNLKIDNLFTDEDEGEGVDQVVEPAPSNDEQDHLQTIEQIINLNMQKIATIFDDI